MTEICGCIACTNNRAIKMDEVNLLTPGPLIPGWRYACEICGNKRCPHHSNHIFKCTRSNSPGQPGSLFQ